MRWCGYSHIPHRSCDPTWEAVSLDMAKLGFFSRKLEVAEHTSSTSCLSLSGFKGVWPWASQQVSFAPDWSMFWWNLKFLKCLRISPPEYRDILLINSKHCNNYSLSKFPSNRHSSYWKKFSGSTVHIVTVQINTTSLFKRWAQYFLPR